MEELIRKLTEAISDFNKYIQNEYSALNKNYSGITNSLGDYSVYTLVAPKMENYKINKTFPRANYITVKINNSTDVIYLTTNTITKEKLQFRDGSRYEGIFSDLYLSYDFSSYGVLPEVQIFIGYNSKYTPITTVKIADVDSGNPLPVTIVDGGGTNIYKFKSEYYNLDNNISTVTISENVSSLIITNTSNTDTLYIGDFSFDNFENYGTPILPGEKFSIDFDPIANGFTFKLGTTGNINVKLLTKYKEIL